LEELTETKPELADEAALWLDFEEVHRRGEFFSLGIGGRSYGLVWPDRRVQPELWQLKKSPQPVQIEAIDLPVGKVKITNRHHFKSLAELAATWRLSADDELLGQGTLDLQTPPGQSEMVTIPLVKPQPVPGVEYRLLVSFSLPRDTAWAAKGHEVAWEQFDLPFHARRESPDPASAEPGFRETDREITVSSGSTSYTFDKPSGTLSSIRFKGKELLREGPKLNAWRAPTANESERLWAGPPIVNQWRAAGLDRLQTEVKEVAVRRGERSVEVDVKTFVSAPDLESGFRSEYRYRFHGNGDVVIEHRVQCVGKMPQWLPKIGLQMTVADTLRHFQWYGRGPFGTYPDRKTGAKIGIYSGTVDELYEPYLIPQDHGNKTDVRWAKLTDPSGDGLFVTGESLLNVSVHKFSTDNLSRALYPYQLVRQEGVTLNIDHRVSGVGGTPIKTLKRYRVEPGDFAYTIRLRPISRPKKASR
jgi:beta-galactosidase